MKKSSRKTTFLSALAIAVPAMGMAQDKVEASVGADLVSGYIWRGQDLGGVSIQPTLSVSYKGFSLSAWGTAGIEKEDTKGPAPSCPGCPPWRKPRRQACAA